MGKELQQSAIRPSSAVSTSIVLSILVVVLSSIWARVSVANCQEIASQGSLSGLAVESAARLWGITIPLLVGGIFVSAFSSWMFFVVVRQRAPKIWLMGLLPHVFVFLVLCWQIIGLEFEAFN